MEFITTRRSNRHIDGTKDVSEELLREVCVSFLVPLPPVTITNDIPMIYVASHGASHIHMMMHCYAMLIVICRSQWLD